MTEKKKLITIAEYCSDKGLSIQDFSDMTGISYSRVFSIRHTVNPVVSIEAIIKVWQATRDKYGAGNALSCTEWLDLPPFWDK